MPKDSNIIFWTREELRAEIKHLRSENLLVREEADRYCRLWQEANSEVERLRKAGDAMADAIKWLPQTISDHHQQAWLAAKEGKQS